MKPLEEQGYVIVAVGQQYLRCAEQLAQSVRYWHPGARVCLITDHAGVTGYDYVHLLQNVNYDNVWANDWQVINLTPFRETIKLEADMLITSPIAHWWPQMRLNEVCVSTGCRNWRDQVSTARHYRKVFDQNHLPDVYNAITYWRRSALAQEFFGWTRDIFQDWDQFRRLLRYSDDVPSTDLVYAMAAQIVGPHRVTQPWSTWPSIVHMKKHVAGTVLEDWTKQLVWEHMAHGLRINGIAQWGAVHYHIKDWKP